MIRFYRNIEIELLCKFGEDFDKKKKWFQKMLESDFNIISVDSEKVLVQDNIGDVNYYRLSDLRCLSDLEKDPLKVYNNCIEIDPEMENPHSELYNVGNILRRIQDNLLGSPTSKYPFFILSYFEPGKNKRPVKLAFLDRATKIEFGVDYLLSEINTLRLKDAIFILSDGSIQRDREYVFLFSKLISCSSYCREYYISLPSEEDLKNYYSYQYRCL